MLPWEVWLSMPARELWWSTLRDEWYDLLAVFNIAFVFFLWAMSWHDQWCQMREEKRQARYKTHASQVVLPGQSCGPRRDTAAPRRKHYAPGSESGRTAANGAATASPPRDNEADWLILLRQCPAAAGQDKSLRNKPAGGADGGQHQTLGIGSLSSAHASLATTCESRESLLWASSSALEQEPGPSSSSGRTPSSFDRTRARTDERALACSVHHALIARQYLSSSAKALCSCSSEAISTPSPVVRSSFLAWKSVRQDSSAVASASSPGLAATRGREGVLPRHTVAALADALLLATPARSKRRHETKSKVSTARTSTDLQSIKRVQRKPSSGTLFYSNIVISQVNRQHSSESLRNTVRGPAAERPEPRQAEPGLQTTKNIKRSHSSDRIRRLVLRNLVKRGFVDPPPPLTRDTRATHSI
jgi:hypothetical protein